MFLLHYDATITGGTGKLAGAGGQGVVTGAFMFSDTDATDDPDHSDNVFCNAYAGVATWRFDGIMTTPAGPALRIEAAPDKMLAVSSARFGPRLAVTVEGRTHSVRLERSQHRRGGNEWPQTGRCTGPRGNPILPSEQGLVRPSERRPQEPSHPPPRRAAVASRADCGGPPGRAARLGGL